MKKLIFVVFGIFIMGCNGSSHHNRFKPLNEPITLHILSDEEKDELMASLEDAAADLQKKSDDLDISEIKKKYSS